MNREPGQIAFPANFERLIAAPLDAATIVNCVSCLTSPDTFKSIVDGNDYSYIGMYVIVTNDTNQYNNGIYVLTNLPTTNTNNWQHVQYQVDNRLSTENKDIIGAINEINKKTGNVATNILTNVPANTKTQLNITATENYIPLELGVISDYNISTTMVAGSAMFKKTIEFIANTFSNNVYITHAEVSNEESINCDNITFDIDVEQIPNTNNLAISALTNVDCVVYTYLTKNIHK